MKTPLILIFTIFTLTLAALACVQPVAIGTLAESTPRTLATKTATLEPTEKATKAPTATPTPVMVYIHGSHNLRANPMGSGAAYGHVSNELVTLLETNENGWMKIQVGRRMGWVSPLAVEER